MCPPKLLSLANVRALALLRAPEKEMDLEPFLAEINPITGAKIDHEFKDAFAYSMMIAEVPVFNPLEPRHDFSIYGLRFETFHPIAEGNFAVLRFIEPDFSRRDFQISSLNLSA